MSEQPIEDRLAEDAVAALPPARDDEPASLRGDILDELRDHMACAYRRELLRTNGDVKRAEANVRQRFGDPVRVARRLWFDAMKGRIMAQRILIGTTAALALAVFVLAFFAWRLVESNRQATAAMLAQGEQTQTALLDRLAAIDKKSEWSGTPEWNPFVLKFVTDAKGSPPASDIEVQIFGPDGDDEAIFHHDDFQPEKDGILELSPARVGWYSVAVTMPSGEKLERELTMYPGRPLEETIVVPAKQLPTVSASFDIERPKSLDGKAPWVVLSFSQSSQRTIDGHKWNFKTPQVIAFHRDGRVVDLLEKYPRRRQGQGLFGQSSWNWLKLAVDRPTGLDNLAAVPLTLWWVTLWPKEELPENPDLLYMSGTTCEWKVEVDTKTTPPVDGNRGHLSTLFGGRGIGGGGDVTKTKMVTGFVSFNRPTPTFELSPDKPNDWTVPIPEELAEQFLAYEKWKTEQSQPAEVDGEA